MNTLLVAAKSDIGMKRKENQDRFRVTVLDDGTAVAVVCDGMGGVNFGGEASDMAVTAIFERLIQNYRPKSSSMTMKNLLVTSISAANTIVYSSSKETVEKNGMGTTCVVAVVRDDIAYIASVGDSRAYLVDDKGIEQVTVDHTYVEMLYEQGKINRDEIKMHNMRNVITKAIGTEKELEVDFFEVDFELGNELLLCTDGLTNHCTDEQLYNFIHRQDIEKAAEDLINYANEQGGKDNITVALICK